MPIEKAIKMIDTYLQEPHSINKEWVKCLLLCKEALEKQLTNGVIVLPCKVGDYLEWDNGISKQVHQIKGFYYEPVLGLRFDLNDISPTVSHGAITRIVPREEVERVLKGGAE